MLMEATPCTNRVRPRVDIAESPEALVLQAELPGVTSEDTDITVDEGVLTIRAKRRAGAPEGTLRVRERHDGEYYRAFALDKRYDLQGIEAETANGVLTVRVPKSLAHARRTVAIH